MARFVGLGLLAVLAAPALALVAGMLVDRGSDGVPRLSAFPAALVVFDPLVWRCVRNSVAVALAVTAGSLVAGTGLGLILGRRRFWGRGILAALVLVPLAIGPTWLIPGVVAWIGGDSGWEWLAARTFLGQPGDDWARWAALVWASLASSTPLVILATWAGLGRVDPAWADAARVVGAGRWRVWADVTWPTIRPDLGRAAGAIFALVLVEPAGPTILGLRRTLAVELADAAFRSPEPNRAAALGAIAGAIAALGWAAFARRSGPDEAPAPRDAGRDAEPRAGARLGMVAVLALLAWATVALGPVVPLGRRVLAALPADRSPGRIAADLLAALAAPELVGWWTNAAVTAGLAVGLACLVARFIRDGASPPGRWLAAIPPLALAAGALAIPPLLTAAADVVGWPRSAAVLRAVATELSPGRAPGVLLILVLAAVCLPGLRRGLAAGPPPDPAGPAAVALLAGASPRSARRLARGGSPTGMGRAALIAWTWASTDLASAWVLAPLPERRTAATAALDLIATRAEPGDLRLVGLFLTLTLVRLVGLALIVRAARSSGGAGA